MFQCVKLIRRHAKLHANRTSGINEPIVVYAFDAAGAGCPGHPIAGKGLFS